MMLDNNTKRTILIIDDNLTNLKAAMRYLEAYSFDILIARDGFKGIKSAELSKPDLILLDVTMPGFDGFETCRRLKANPTTKHIPVIFMTAATETAAKVQGLEIGAVDYITKPFEAAELLARVNTHLALHDLQERLELLVQERTAALEAEIAQRQQQQTEKEQLWQTIHQQNEQFHNLTRAFLESQTQRQRHLDQTLHQHFSDNIQLLTHLLNHTQQALPDANTHAKRQHLATQLAQMENITHHLQQHTQEMMSTLKQDNDERDALLQNPLIHLSNREQQVIQLLVAGKATKEVAELLGVASGTVSTYRRRIMEKLNVTDFAGVVQIVNQYTS